jgi:hypothetical protein
MQETPSGPGRNKTSLSWAIITVMEEFISWISWGIIIILCLTLGLAPYRPPHIWEKLLMLMRGELVRPVDWFDLLLHAVPWALLVLKAVYAVKGK